MLEAGSERDDYFRLTKNGNLYDGGVGVAVANAIDEVLEAADFVTESNDRDGVAKYIEKNWGYNWNG